MTIDNKTVKKVAKLAKIRITVADEEKLIYELNNINEFWDGTILSSGRIAPLGIYVFLIELKNSRGQFITKKGSITLIR